VAGAGPVNGTLPGTGSKSNGTADGETGIDTDEAKLYLDSVPGGEGGGGGGGGGKNPPLDRDGCCVVRPGRAPTTRLALRRRWPWRWRWRYRRATCPASSSNHRPGSEAPRLVPGRLRPDEVVSQVDWAARAALDNAGFIDSWHSTLAFGCGRIEHFDEPGRPRPGRVSGLIEDYNHHRRALPRWA